MNGLSFINIELTSHCNAHCWMCGRRKMEREYPELCDWGDMPKEMVYEISRKVPEGSVVQFHNNGEPLLYPYLGWALALFSRQIRSFNTNGKLLLDKKQEIIENLETLTISVIQDDPEGDAQYESVKSFLEYKGSASPLMVYRLLGTVDDEERWGKLPGITCRRVLHSPDGSYQYRSRVTRPEIGICLDLLTHLAIDRYGNISMCVRFDPKGELRIGRVETGIEAAWNSDKRKYYLEKHIKGERNCLPGCNKCEYYGVATSP